MANIVLPQVDILSEINNDTNILIEQNGIIQRVNKNTFLEDTSQEAVLYTAQTLTDEQQAQARENIGVLEPLIGYSSDITPAQVSAALLEGREVVLSYTDETYGVIYFSGFIEVPAFDVVATSGIQTMSVNGEPWTMRFSLAGGISNGLWNFQYGRIADYSDIPTAIDSYAPVSYNAQTLTDTQKAQARENIGIEDVIKNMNQVPASTSSDNGKFLRVVDGVPAWVTLPNAEEASF